jgi:hypothetical protein
MEGMSLLIFNGSVARVDNKNKDNKNDSDWGRIFINTTQDNNNKPNYVMSVCE